MNKGELIDIISEEAGITKEQAKLALESFLDAIASSLEKNEEVNLRGFGTFLIRTLAEKKIRSIATGKKITIKARNVPKFIPSKSLRKGGGTHHTGARKK